MIVSRGLNHININVRDLKRSLKFYQDAFGLEIRFWGDDKMVFVGAPGERDLITLCETGPAEPVGTGGGISHFGFRFDNAQAMDAIVAQIEHAGGKLDRRGEHGPGEPFAYFFDPDGYLIEIGV